MNILEDKFDKLTDLFFKKTPLTQKIARGFWWGVVILIIWVVLQFIVSVFGWISLWFGFKILVGVLVLFWMMTHT